MNVSDINPSVLMITTIFGIIVKEIWEFIKRKYTETRPIKKLKNIKIINALWIILAYILPLGTIIYLIIENKSEPTFRNIALFTIICVSLIFNILMSHIRAIYRMFTELTSKSSDNFLVYKKAINIIFEAIGKTERLK